MNDVYPKTLRIVLGQTLQEVEANSSWKFLPSNLDDFHPFIFTEPTVFEYTGRNRAFTLSTGLTCGFGSIMGEVTHGFATPHPRHLQLDEVKTLCQDIVKILDAAGWKRDERSFPSPADFAPKMLVKEGFLAGKWHAFGDAAKLVVTRSRRAEETFEQFPADQVFDRYLVEVRVSNDTVMESAKAKYNARAR